MTGYRIDPYVVESLLPDLAGHDRKLSAFAVYLYLWHRTRRQRGRPVACSYQEMASETGLSKRTVQLSVGHLLRRKLIGAQQATRTAVPVYRVFAPWRRVR